MMTSRDVAIAILIVVGGLNAGYSVYRMAILDRPFSAALIVSAIACFTLAVILYRRSDRDGRDTMRD